MTNMFKHEKFVQSQSLIKRMTSMAVVFASLLSLQSNVAAYDDLPINDIPRPGGAAEITRVVDEAIAKNRERMRRQHEQFESWRSDRKASFEASFLDGHKISVIPDGATLLAERLRAIRSATRSIYLSAFIFDADKTAKQLMGALCTKARQGVDVRLMVDSFGGKNFFAYENWMRDHCGIGVMRFNPPHWGLNKLVYVIHEKLLIIDGSLLLMGGNGWQNSYHHVQPAHKFFHDLELRIEGPAACYFQKEFIKTYLESIRWDIPMNFDGPSRTRTQEERMFGPRTFEVCDESKKGDSRISPVYANPLFSKDKPIFEAYLNAMLSLEDGAEIKLYAPYFVAHERFVHALLWARSRNMKVTVITNSIESNDEGADTVVATALSVGELVKAGVEIKLWKGPYTLHRKAGVYGTKYAYAGSDNLDSRGHFYSSESIAFTDDAKIVQETTALFDADIENTNPMTKEVLERILSHGSSFKRWLVREVLLKYM